MYPNELLKLLEPEDPSALVEALDRLQAGFTVDQDTRRGGYLRQADAVAAYGAFYGLRTATKVAHIVRELGLTPEHVVDVAGGTLGAALGVAAAAPGLRRVTGLDRANPALRFGAETLARYRPKLEINTRRWELLRDQTVPPGDLIVLANFLDELNEERRVHQAVQSALQALPPGGVLLLLEPGTQRASHRLSRLRDDVAGAIPILGPCTGARRCPYAENPGDGWCFAEIEVEEPTWLESLREAAGIRRSRLTYSWLALARERAPTTNGQRVISGPMAVGRYVCDRRGRGLRKGIAKEVLRGTLLDG
jgi:ribosomal protein RSM22 (predicted rRNA methylase)